MKLFIPLLYWFLIKYVLTSSQHPRKKIWTAKPWLKGCILMRVWVLSWKTEENTLDPFFFFGGNCEIKPQNYWINDIAMNMEQPKILTPEEQARIEEERIQNQIKFESETDEYRLDILEVKKFSQLYGKDVEYFLKWSYDSSKVFWGID